MLDVTVPQNVKYCIPQWLRDEQIKLSLGRISGRIQQHSDRTEPIAIVGFGPSLNDTWEDIQKFRYVMSCSGSHKFLLERGIIPTWHVEVDPREHKVELLGPPHHDVEYLIASCCHPKVFDHLFGMNVKLWHVFSADDESMRLLPRGEWALTGGSNVGLRALTIARFLGFKDFHIFGMDGSSGESGKHAAAHPNQPKKFDKVEYDGVMYETSPAFLECARQTFHELDELGDITVKFYGEGLIQAMAKNWERKPPKTGSIAVNRPELISAAYLEMNKELHETNLSYGIGGNRHVDMVLQLVQATGVKSVLDYGCGKGYLAKALPFPIWEYDPAIPGKAESPRKADLVVCTDVLEHVEVDKLAFVLDDIRRCMDKIGYFTISTASAQKTFPNGKNTHLIQQNERWWKKTLKNFFDIGKVINEKSYLKIVVGTKAL